MALQCLVDSCAAQERSQFFFRRQSSFHGAEGESSPKSSWKAAAGVRPSKGVDAKWFKEFWLARVDDGSVEQDRYAELALVAALRLSVTWHRLMHFISEFAENCRMQELVMRDGSEAVFELSPTGTDTGMSMSPCARIALADGMSADEYEQVVAKQADMY